MLKTYADLSGTAAVAWGEEYYAHPIARRMRDNLMKFAGAKTYQMLETFRASKAAGMSEDEFVKLAHAASEKYNGAYLDAERAFTAGSANSARDWQQFVKDKDIYKSLRFRTMGDESVSDSHRALEGVTRRVNDSYWLTHTPPLRPRCRCWLEQTNDPETEPAYIEIAPQFAGNPGVEGEVFNKHTPYFQMPTEKTGAIVRENSELMKFHAPYSRVEQVGKNKVYVSDFADPADLDANLKAAGLMAKGLGKEVYIRPHIYAKNYKNPEFAIGEQSMHGDLKNYQAVVKGKPVPVENFIGRQLAKANKQGCNYAVLNFADEKIPDFEAAITRNLFGEINGINQNLQNFVVIRRGKVSKISRKEIESKEFESFLKKLK